MSNLTSKRVLDVEKDFLELVKLEPKFLRASRVCGLPKLRSFKTGFTGLFKIIISQQLSTSAASSIWRNLEDSNLTQIESVLNVNESKLRGLGLSKAKVSYVKGLAEAKINYDLLSTKPDSDIISELCSIRGIGLWTAQIYLIFSLRRPDVFAPGDLALKEGARILFDMEDRPSSEDLDDMSQDWRPYRTIAAMIFWEYYSYQKGLKE